MQMDLEIHFMDGSQHAWNTDVAWGRQLWICLTHQGVQTPLVAEIKHTEAIRGQYSPDFPQDAFQDWHVIQRRKAKDRVKTVVDKGQIPGISPDKVWLGSALAVLVTGGQKCRNGKVNTECSLGAREKLEEMVSITTTKVKYPAWRGGKSVLYHLDFFPQKLLKVVFWIRRSSQAYLRWVIPFPTELCPCRSLQLRLNHVRIRSP